jgi:spore coat protein CotH
VALCDGDPSTITRPGWWSKISHCPDVEAGYTELFTGQVVRRIDITVAASDYQATLDDLDNNYSGSTASADLDSLPTPIWIPATIKYADKTWTQVGLRWKGHASLKGAWQRGVRKLAFSLQFDKYEDSHPELDNQRFYGFKKLSFSNGYNDPSLIREKTAASIFRAAGVPAARSSFAAVYMDWGKGAVYLGVYTIVEDPSDQMLTSQIGKSGGNLYKPWGVPAKWLSLADVSQTDIQTYFEKQTNSSDADWSDISAALTALHADRTDAATWRQNLEKVFNVTSFIKTLAVNQVIVNWDSYGCMHHNYLVYANPKDDSRFLWMPWDLNESMKATVQSGCPAPGSVMLDEIVNADASIDSNWPLIEFILGDSQYRAVYKAQLRAVLDGAFASDTVTAQMQADYNLISPYVIGPTATEVFPYTNTTAEDFSAALTTGDDALIPHVAARHGAVEAVLASGN